LSRLFASLLARDRVTSTPPWN